MPSCTSAQLGGDGEQVRANGAGLGAPQPPARIPRATPRAPLDFLGVIFRAVPDLLLPCRSCLPTQVASLDGPQLAPQKAAGEPAAVQGPRRCWRRLGGRRAAGDDFFDLAAFGGQVPLAWAAVGEGRYPAGAEITPLRPFQCSNVMPRGCQRRTSGLRSAVRNLALCCEQLCSHLIWLCEITRLCGEDGT